MKIAIIVGSLRKESYNRKVAGFLVDRHKASLDLEIVPIDKLPLFNEDIEEDPPVPVIEFKEKIKESDGVLFITPEYNHSIPGGLKNALDWSSRGERVLVAKPTFVMGASNGNIGTARCQSHLLQVLNSTGVLSLNLPGIHVLMSNIQNDFDKEGNYTNERTIKYLDKVMNKFIQWIEKNRE